MAAVVIIGIMVGAAAQSWTTFMKREREEELIFRGTQYMNAIKLWYNHDPGTGKATYKKPQPGMPQPALMEPSASGRPLRNLEDLLWDPYSPNPTPFIRRLYKDPMTNKDFVAILDANQAIIGVRSTSEDEPIKKGNFPDELQELNDKMSYKEWAFVYRAKPLTPAVNTQVTPPGSSAGSH
jgi:type II secretory pathway pseudopilin PulG